MFTDQQSNDFHLLPGSPCIGSGRDADDRGALLFDPTVIEDINSLPDEFAVMSNYPNPFNAQTTIGYNLPEAMDVEIKIYDILGRYVESFTYDKQPAGHHTIVWQAERVSSGVYFYKVTAGETEQIKRMLLLK
ncbi:MAG: T9SS type A sorting domain-containing protein [candidate division Zixibacteria bacterium]|nr:T9SS type A sorting domain-containing protein [candidate division Zixibacteria bacterium]